MSPEKAETVKKHRRSAPKSLKAFNLLLSNCNCS